ncbi:multidrug resistance-associated protein 1 isoform X7 [Tribolium castaneum]|uniref:multidrug resistance-associated protein 1 isoform X7 n=1 Tax=Tribolium castaneum TaxID=7070 RepID=UPI0030FF211C
MAASTMDKFCGSEFWNSTLTWHTNDPDLTKCFERTVLVWVPCAFLWTFSSLEVYYILHSKRRDIPWNWLNVSKLLGTAVLFVLTVTDLVTAVNSASSSESDVYKVDIYTPVIKLLSFGLSAVLLVYNRKYGLCTSGLQFLFWLSLAICGAFQYRTELRGSQEEIPESRYSYISYLIYYPVVLVMLFLNCFADRSPRRSEYPKLKNPCPEENSSFLSRLLFSWFDSLAWRGFRRPLVDSDLWDMKPEDSASEVVPTFEKHWKRILQKCESNSPTRQTRASYKLDSARVDIVNSSTKKQASILPALVKAFGPTFIFGALLKLIQDLLTFVSPHILNLLIQFVKNNEEQWKGFLYAGALFVTATIQTIVLSQYFNRMFVVGMRIRTALVSAIYKKALRVSNKARKESTVGEIVNLMSVDAQKFIDLTAYINMIWSAPLQIILALYFLWNILGPAVLAGLAVMIILIPVNGYIANKVKVLQIKQMKNKDERVKLMNEVLSGIKVLKLYAWEPSFEKQILKIRTKEIQVLKEAAYMNAGTSFIWSCAPFLAMVSIQRINKFMNAEELDPTSVTHDSNESAPLVIENGCFNWDEEQVLKNINIRIEKKSLCAVVGSVGSGKSSLLSAFLGEMDKTSGRVNTVGTIAYVSQQAWIQNATLRDNILFGKSFDKSLYDKVVEACALNPDFAMLPAGDQTEIGEKGINLSGGQKQRVSLARAVYANSDIYFLDDPLSAVDSHVGKHIFDKVIGPEGLLRHKTRVLVTHGITYLPQTDKIIVLKDGEVSEGGTYQELLDKKGAFSEFLLQHINEVEEDEEELDVLKSQLSGTAVSEEINKKLSRHRSRVSESVSETGSDQTSLSLQRQKSVESADKSLRHRSSSVEEAKKVKGEKLIEVEKAETGSVKWIVYKHYLKSIGVFLTVATILLNMLFQGFSIGSNVWLGVWADDDTVVVDNVTDTGKRDFYLGIYGALGIGQAVATLLSALSLYIGAVNGAQLLHHLLLSNILRVPCTTFFDVTPVGRILNRFSKDVDTLDNILPMTLRGWITCFFSVLGTLVVISVSTPIFIAVIVPIGILYYFIQRFYVATSRQLKRLESVSRSPIYSHFGETITGVQAIRAFREQDRFIKESEHRVDVNQVCYYPSIISNRWLAVRLEMIGNLIIFFAALFSVLGRDESQNAGLVGLSVTYSLQITQTLNWLVRMTSDVETNIVAVERIKEYGEAPQEAPWEIPNKAPSPQWPENGTVQFNKYAVRYRPGLDLVLKGVNFSINGGEKVGIVGRTGAGKSSLTLALFRIIEAAEGEILIDGVNIADLGLHTLRSRLTIIPQDAVLFSGTLRMNLDPFDKHSDEEVWKALEHAHLKSFVKGLTAGLHHEVTEGGENLSVGQRQLICLSRALLRKTKVLILDEATAAVDLETDDLIQKTIRSEFKNCTVLTIAHRLNTIMDSDRVVVLDNGRIVEFDSPSNLLKQQQSIFYSMCKDAGLV